MFFYAFSVLLSCLRGHCCPFPYFASHFRCAFFAFISDLFVSAEFVGLIFAPRASTFYRPLVATTSHVSKSSVLWNLMAREAASWSCCEPHPPPLPWDFPLSASSSFEDHLTAQVLSIAPPSEPLHSRTHLRSLQHVHHLCCVR